MRMRFKVALAFLACMLAWPAPAAAQIAQYDPEYLETLYGPIRDVSLSDLSFNPESYNGRGVRVRGRIGMTGIQGTSWELSDGGARVTIVPIRRGMNEDQLTSLGGQNVEVTGPTRSAHYSDEKSYGPLMIQGDHGPVAVRKLKITPLHLP